jgi:hypothetical protein
MLIFFDQHIRSEREAFALEMQALEYHTRAMATPNGIAELENLINYIK